MCGIAAFVGNKPCLDILINMLRKVEYRGYDSAGIAINTGNDIKIRKDKGKIDKIFKALPRFNGNIGIAHTRWATHGKPSKRNAHPLADCNKNIFIVHNGIIENYSALKSFLKESGHRFSSETDSEIIAHLIEEFYEDDLFEAVKKALNEIEGTYGLVVMHINHDYLVAAKNGSPVLIGKGNGFNLIASDVTAIVKYTRDVIYLDDYEIAKVGIANIQLYDMKKKQDISKDVERIRLKIGEIEKSGYKHFMLKEIFEQPQAIRNVILGRVRNNKVKLSIDIDFNKVRRILLCGCGTSWHACLVGKYIIESICRLPVDVDYASEFRYRNPLIGKDDVFIAVSQSGETADTLAALKEAKRKGAKIMGIVNVVGSSIAREAKQGIYLHAGPEIGVASTKAFTNQIMALLLLAIFIAQQNGKRVDKTVFNEIKKTSANISSVLKNAEYIAKIAKKFKNSKNFIYLGRGINYPVALEGALKLKEISYIHAEGLPAAEMKHGPIALIDRHMPVVFIATRNGTAYEKIINNMQEVKARDGTIIAVCNSRDKRIEKLTDYKIIVPRTCEFISPIINVIPLQLLAYYIADFKRLNVDKPRNLAKSVTVE